MRRRSFLKAALCGAALPLVPVDPARPELTYKDHSEKFDALCQDHGEWVIALRDTLGREYPKAIPWESWSAEQPLRLTWEDGEIPSGVTIQEVAIKGHADDEFAIGLKYGPCPVGDGMTLHLDIERG